MKTSTIFYLLTLLIIAVGYVLAFFHILNIYIAFFASLIIFGIGTIQVIREREEEQKKN